MKAKRYQHICSLDLDQGNVLVNHPSTDEKGTVTRCIPQTKHLLVETTDHETRCWEFSECDEIVSL